MFEHAPVLTISASTDIQQLNHCGYAVVDKKTGPDTYTLKIGNDKVAIKASGDFLNEGDSIRYQIKNNHLIIEKKNPSATAAFHHDDSFALKNSNENSTVKVVLGTIIDNLENSSKPNQAIINETESILNSFRGKLEKIAPETLQNVDKLLSQLKNREITQTDKSELIELLRNIESSCSKLTQSPKTSHYQLVGLLDKNIPEGIYRLSSNLTQENISALLSELKTDFQGNMADLFLRTIPAQDNNTIAITLPSQDILKELLSLKSLFSSPIMKTIPSQVYENILLERGEIPISALRELDSFFMSSGSTTLSPVRAGSETAQVETLTQWLRTALDFTTDAIAQRCPFSQSLPISSLEKVFGHIFSSDKIPGITHQTLNENTDKSSLISDIAEKLGYNFEHKILNSTSQEIFDHLVSNNLKKNLLSLISTGSFQTGSELFHSVKEYASIISDTIGFAQKIVANPNFIRQDYGLLAENNLIAIENKFSELIDKISNYITELRSSGNSISQPNLLLLKDTITRLYNNVPDIFKQLSEELKQEAFSAGNSPESITAKVNKTREMLTELDSILKKTALEPDTLAKSQQNISLARPLRDSAESFLSRLESLQLLARNTSTPDGEQQILALPMKISGEWTEANIRFVKKKVRGKSSNRPRQYTVFLNVSPVSTGAISVKMDYTAKKALTLEMEFEQKAVKDWFEQNKNRLNDILSGIGFSSVMYNFTSQRKTQRSLSLQNGLPKGDIDLKI